MSLENTKKWQISIYCGLVFLLFSSDIFYKNLSNLLNIKYDGCPSYSIMLISSVLFGLLLRWNMKHEGKSIDKWRYTYYTWYMFVFFNNPLMYNMVDNIIGKYIDTANGNCPTKLGNYLHTILFIIVLRYSMDLEPNNKKNE
jgi:hypothetical protein